MAAENHSQLQWLIHRENLTGEAIKALNKAKKQQKRVKPVLVPRDPFHTTFFPRPDRRKKCVADYLKRLEGKL
jgi:hypothetical protein